VRAIGGDEGRGAFVVVPIEGPDGTARRVVEALARRGVIADARGAFLRLCPDPLTSEADTTRAAAALAASLVDACA